MHRIGTVVRTAQGSLVVRAVEADWSDGSDDGSGGERDETVEGMPTDIGTLALEESLEEVGRVVDVFGPVERPYLLVRPNERVHPPSLVGKPLYARGA